MKKLVLMIISAMICIVAVIGNSLLGNSVETRMTMTVQAPGKISIGLQSSDNVTIDWGDGMSVILDGSAMYEKVRSVSIFTGRDTVITRLTAHEHVYTGTSVYTVTIAGTNITALECSSDNKLTGLDVGKNTALTSFNCRNSQLTVAALNALFETLLPAGNGKKRLLIGGNTGTDDCDRSIAENKGWVVVN